MSQKKLSMFKVVLLRGAKGVCPQCGKQSLFESGFRLFPKCSHCALDFLANAPDHWALMYLSTAFLTGCVIIVMLMVQPANLLLGRVLLVLGALAVWLGTYRFRKGLTVALLYLSDLLWNNQGQIRLRPPHSS